MPSGAAFGPGRRRGPHYERRMRSYSFAGPCLRVGRPTWSSASAKYSRNWLCARGAHADHHGARRGENWGKKTGCRSGRSTTALVPPVLARLVPGPAQVTRRTWPPSRAPGVPAPSRPGRAGGTSREQRHIGARGRQSTGDILGVRFRDPPPPALAWVAPEFRRGAVARRSARARAKNEVSSGERKEKRRGGGP